MSDLAETGPTGTRYRATLDVTADPSPDASSDADPAHAVHHLRLPGRVLIQGSEEETCLLRWVRGLVARVVVDNAAASLASGRAILYLDLIGRIEGTISWVSAKEIDVAIVAPSAKSIRLQQQFAKLAAMAHAERETVRGCARIVPNTSEVALCLTGGPTTVASVCDISRSGAAVKASILPETGSIVVLGSTRGRVVRQFADGFAVQFLRLLPLETFGPSYGL